jgi:hypothetical protein
MTSIPIIDVSRARNGDNRKPCHALSHSPGIRPHSQGASLGFVTAREKGLIGIRDSGVTTSIWLATPSTSGAVEA